MTDFQGLENLFKNEEIYQKSHKIYMEQSEPTLCITGFFFFFPDVLTQDTNIIS